MADPNKLDDEFTRLARAYLGQLSSSAPRANLARRVVDAAMSRRRRFSLGAVLGGSAIMVVGAATAVVVLATHRPPVADHGVRPAIPTVSVTPPANPFLPSPSASATPSPGGGGAVTISAVTLHAGVPLGSDGPPDHDFRAGHSLFCDNGIRYDNAAAAPLGPGQFGSPCLLSQNGLHYAYETNHVYVDGHRFSTVAVPPGQVLEVIAVSNDGQSLMYRRVYHPNVDNTQNHELWIYRNSTIIYHADNNLVEVAASGDLQHTVIVDGPAATWVADGPEKVLYDGRVVMPLGGDSRHPLISANGAHWGFYTMSLKGNHADHAVIDGRTTQTNWSTSGFISDNGHWSLFDLDTNSVVTDGVSRRVTAGNNTSNSTAQVALSDDGQHRAALVDNHSVLTLDGTARNVPAGVWYIDFVGDTLYVYYLTQ
ncbi:MAG: hypothetical protein M3019_04500 [Candidatus Dormibacteraeota bacterium]|nr:hypothetical protein [Candidatus Dormibacteraeota bacterium]